MASKKMSKRGSRWRRVVGADECPPCPDCGEPFCKRHGMHYADCDCIGPTMDECEYRVVKGVLYGRRI